MNDKENQKTNNEEITPEEDSTDKKKMTRRQFIKNALRIGIYTSVVGLGLYSFLYEPGHITMERLELPVHNLPPYWEGKKIVLVSDIHRSEVVSTDFLSKAFQKINAEKPDVIFLTGDYVTGSREYIDSLKSLLLKLKTKTGDGGKIAVLGNHDYWTDADYIKKRLTQGGFQILVNEKKDIGPTGAKLRILGADDLWCGVKDIKRLLGMVNPDRDAVILLSHNPDIFLDKEFGKIPVTVLAGHTHGGQVNLPIIGAPIVPAKFVRGFYKKGESLMYVNRGLGLIAPPIRFNCPPEITVFKLVKE
ncbi:MAG: metallophosphoesterase [Candidatus Eremiobacteraeota bacterium]|nr:metallophosphoesterase [Candidatus Eremiobacteraeota bacterium]